MVVIKMKNIGTEDISKLVRKEFEIIGADFDSEVKKDVWSVPYTMTSLQKEEWKKVCIDCLRNEYDYTKRAADRAFMWIDMMFGFSVTD